MLKYKCEKSIHRTMVSLFTREWLYLMEKVASYKFYAKERQWEEASHQRDCVLMSFDKLDEIIHVWGAISPQMLEFGYFLWKCAFVKAYEPNERDLKGAFSDAYKSWRIYNGRNN